MKREYCTMFRSILDASEKFDIETRKLLAYACLQYDLNGTIIPELEENVMAEGLFIAVKANIDSSIKHQEDGKKGGRGNKKEEPEEDSSEENDEAVPAAESECRGATVDKHGQHNNVRLSENDYNILVKNHGEDDTEEAIEILDQYIEGLEPEEKRKYLRRCHRACIERWGYDAVKERRAKRQQLNHKVRNFADPRGILSRPEEHTPEFFADLERRLVEN